MINNKEWVWTDELVTEFIHWRNSLTRPIYDPMKDFKELKSKERIPLFTDEQVSEIRYIVRKILNEIAPNDKV